MVQPIATFDQVGLSYDQQRLLFKNLNFVLETGSFYFLTGSSGSGKSSLLRLLYLNLAPTWGKLTLFGQEISKMSLSQKNRLRQDMGIVFQEFKLLNHLTVIENVALPLRIRGLDGFKSRDQAKELLKWVGVDALDAPPHALSGGEKQRVAIARAVISRPKLLLADEPTGSVDDQSALKLFHLFEELHKIGTTVVLATHNRELLQKFPHTVLHLEDGKLASFSQKLFNNEIKREAV
ncbi:MAG: cell division ATP-binding protein FtsE [Alphaproteobacteria bacterium]